MITCFLFVQTDELNNSEISQMLLNAWEFRQILTPHQLLTNSAAGILV